MELRETLPETSVLSRIQLRNSPTEGHTGLLAKVWGEGRGAALSSPGAPPSWHLDVVPSVEALRTASFKGLYGAPIR